MVWTIDDVPDQSSKVIFITGATSGVGLESARVFAQRGAHLVLACRNKEKMAKVADELRGAGARVVDELICDTSDLDSVCSCAEAYNGPPLDVLLLNAGMAGKNLTKTRQGYERVFATNHIGHWLLTGLLLNKVKGRIVVVSSIAHLYVSNIDWNAVADGDTTTEVMYGQSKLANLLFVEQLNRRLSQVDSQVIAVGCHPGFATTEIASKLENPGIFVRIFWMLAPLMAQPGAHGAWPLLMAATDDNVNRDCYYAPSKGALLSESWGPPISNGKKSDTLKNVELAEEMWAECEKLCDFKYSF